jgi:hypothetical protein
LNGKTRWEFLPEPQTVYYLDAKRDRTKLTGYLNGNTGEQIVDMVAWGK